MISNTSQTIRVCLCGRPFNPNISGYRGRAATQDIASFNTSLAAAQAYQKTLSTAAKNAPAVPVTLNALAGKFATPQDVSSLLDITTELAAKVKTLESKTAVYGLPGVLEGLAAPLMLNGTEQLESETSAEPEVKKADEAAAEPAAAETTATEAATSAKEPHPNSKEGRELRAQRLKNQMAAEGKTVA